MTFNTALSGLRAASEDLAVTGNNIANASTVGFKRSRAEFGDVYAVSLVGGGGTAAGNGVVVQEIAQQFGQGNISFTDNSLDLAISGGGFFILSDQGAETFSRAGYFSLDSSGFIVSNNNSRLQGYGADATGTIQTGILTDLKIPTSDITPSPTSAVDINFNLDSREAPITAPFVATDASTWNSSTSLTVYDSQGNPHVMSNYFVKTADNTWRQHVEIDGTNVITAGAFANPYFEYSFNSDGTLASSLPAPTLTIDTWNPPGGSDQSPTSNFTLDIGTSTQFGSDFNIASIDQDGFAPGRLAGVEVDKSGVLFARYTNGEALTLGQVVLGNFDNVQGLTPLGDSTWAQSFESGTPVRGVPQSGSLGALQSGALEESNVNLSEELVHLIIAQRNFQANAKTIETADTVTQAIINIR
jgi:flagellar hook protein FlgE